MNLQKVTSQSYQGVRSQTLTAFGGLRFGIWE